MRAELDALVCSGARRGKQFTYALVDERAPQTRNWTRDEALAELTRCYFTGHGPATARDFAWWSGLTMKDVNAGLDMLSSRLAREVIEGKTYWLSASMPPTTERCDATFLLPTYDEFLIGYSGYDRSRTGGQDIRASLVFDSTIVIGGKMVGSWKRTIQKGTAVIEIAPLAAAEAEAVSAAARRYGEFFEMPVTVA